MPEDATWGRSTTGEGAKGQNGAGDPSRMYVFINIAAVPLLQGVLIFVFPLTAR